MIAGDWAREVEAGGLSVSVGPEGVSLAGPQGSEPLDPVRIERLYQALTTYRMHSNQDWEWSRSGHDWWK